jgi:GWxTD domain-containing protein
MRLRCFFFFLLVSAVISRCPGQTDAYVARPDSVLRVAHRYLTRGSADTARVLFESLLASHESVAQARLGLLQALMAQGEWWDASHLCDTLLENSSQDIAVQYCAGICEREWGAQTAGFIRMVAWRKARDHFEAVLARDSLYKDVLYQFALLKEYKEDLVEAIDMAHRQVLLRPELVAAKVGLFHIYRHYLSETDADDALAWLQSQRNDYSLYFAAEVLRRSKLFAEAESTFIELLERPSRVPPQACYLSLAHLNAIVNNKNRAQYCYWKAVDGIASWVGADLIFEELKYIITDKELEQYHALSSDRRKIAFFHRFWQVRDPMPATPVNYRLIEHLQRMVQAEEQFEYYGTRAGFSNPDRTGILRLPRAFYLNKEFNDLGLVFLRQGPPNKIERTMGNAPPVYDPSDPTRFTQQEVSEHDSWLSSYDQGMDKVFERIPNANTFGPTAIDPHQSWVYFATGTEPQRIFHFALHNTARQNWRLSPLPGDPDHLDKEMLAELAMYDPRYERLKKQSNVLESTGLVADLQLEEKKVVTTALTSDRHVWSNGTRQISIPHAIDAFRNSSGGTLLDVSYAVPYQPLRDAVGPDTRKTLVEVGLSIESRSGTRVIDSKLDTLDLLLTPDGKGFYIGLFRQVLVADSVRLMAHVRALQAPAVGTWAEPYRVPSFAGRDFMVSDVQLLLPATYGPVIEIDGVKVQQSPFTRYSSGKPLYAYLQVYNLIRDIQGSAGYTARFTLAPADNPQESTLLAEVKRDLTDESTRAEFQMLDIAGVSPGRYTLTVAVTDRKRVETLVKSREIEITE